MPRKTFVSSLTALSIIHWAGPADAQSEVPFEICRLDERAQGDPFGGSFRCEAYTICVDLRWWGLANERSGSRRDLRICLNHMMFQGSENVGKGEHFILIQNNGGSMNGTTSSDRTNCFETISANQLDLACSWRPTG